MLFVRNIFLIMHISKYGGIICHIIIYMIQITDTKICPNILHIYIYEIYSIVPRQNLNYLQTYHLIVFHSGNDGSTLN